MISTPEDRRIFQNLLRITGHQKGSAASSGELVIAAGIQFLGTPYVSNTLEQKNREKLVINLRQLDCFTFVENTVVLAGLIKAGTASFSDFAAALKKFRYRKGLLGGYSSRLHYFSDWLYDNQEKGIIEDITWAAGGEPFSKEINFMTSNRDKYPALKCEDEFVRMLAMEKTCSTRVLYHISKTGLKVCVDKIKHGDIIAITTNVEGLDIIHAGFGIYLKNNLHLLHASRRAGKVIVSEETLHRYLVKRKTRLGVMIGRVL